MPGGEVVTLFETLRNVLPRSLFTHLGEPPRAIEVPHRVAELIRAREEESERLIGWVQLVMTATFAALYVIAPRPLDAGMSMLAPVPLALTGYAAFTAARLWFAHRGFLPAARVAVLVNPTNPTAETTVRDVEPAARAMGLQIQVLNASTSREINAAFATFVRERPDAVFVSLDAFFGSRRAQLVNLASRHALPATYSTSDFAEIGGLMSYGTNIVDAFRQVGVYTGRILKGAKPAELPVVQASKFELVINAQTALMLGLTVPPSLLATADEVIE
jgi:putative tryptophan/tyrosine transport system substrate-binding protein